ncbi:MBOAT family O-acyltransferase [Afifella aestuarii]|uniref:MBOAT family O-acyltransferase n=1 Tax=Afifella aestuarii TaxID=1909496 RepID=UPI000FE3BDD6|nr:MBOAT family protein [Afifella aestuarii]
MVFSSQVFVFFFLPAALFAGIATRHSRYFPLTVFLSSMVFFFWSSGALTLVFLASITINFLGALLIDKTRSRGVLIGVVAANLAILGFFKYTAFLLSNVDLTGLEFAKGFAADIVLPIGISFYTFQGISYVIDVWRGEVAAARNPILFGAYQSFFPQLIAGPIVRYRDVAADFRAPSASFDLFNAGACRFMMGLTKKVIIADTAARAADAAFGVANGDVTFATAWIGAIAYTIQIYFDFSGYSDMAIGIAMMFGIRFRENFNHPYAAKTVTEFWRRWHISLSTWFRDYLYIPLGGNRRGPARTYANLAIVFFATGLWHGAAWTFVLWGLYHGAFLILERLVWGRQAGDQRGALVRLVYLAPVVVVGWVLFKANDLAQFAAFLKAMASPLAGDAWSLAPLMVGALTPLTVLVLLLASAAALAQGQYTPLGVVVARPARSRFAEPARALFIAATGLLLALFILPQAYSPFLYFRF